MKRQVRRVPKLRILRGRCYFAQRLLRPWKDEGASREKIDLRITNGDEFERSGCVHADVVACHVLVISRSWSEVRANDRIDGQHVHHVAQLELLRNLLDDTHINCQQGLQQEKEKDLPFDSRDHQDKLERIRLSHRHRRKST